MYSKKMSSCRGSDENVGSRSVTVLSVVLWWCITVDTCANWRRQERAPTTWYPAGDSNVAKPWLVSGAGEGKEYAGRLCPFYQFPCEAEAALKIRIL